MPIKVDDIDFDARVDVNGRCYEAKNLKATVHHYEDCVGVVSQDDPSIFGYGDNVAEAQQVFHLRVLDVVSNYYNPNPVVREVLIGGQDKRDSFLAKFKEVTK